MAKIRIHHKPTYRYIRPVKLGPHRLMLRPRESRELRLLSNEIAIMPNAELSWAHDVSGNAIATATFADKADTLVIDSVSEVLLDSKAWPVFPIVRYRLSVPVFGR